MDKKYVTLFQELAQAMATSAETVMEYNHNKGDAKGEATATTMRDDYQELTGIIKDAGDDYTPNKAEVAKLLVGAMVMTNQLQDRVNAIKQSIAGYQKIVIPRLQEILDTAKTDDEAKKMANEKFIIKNEE